MGITRRLFDLARANLNALLERAGGDDGLGQFSDEEIAHELERRQGQRRRADEQRAARAAAERAAAERAATERATRERTAGRAAGSRAQPGAAPRKRPPPGRDPRLAALYARLEAPYGADLDTVRKSFHRLMRKYHPDVAGHSPEQQRAATELSSELTLAYRELELLLAKRT